MLTSSQQAPLDDLGDFLAPYPVQFRGSSLAKWLLGLGGWQVRYEGLPTRQGVVVIYPHTSSWDFVVGILAKWSLGLPLQFWGKDTLFEVPVFGAWLRWLGGIPVVRTSAHGVVDAAVKQFKDAQREDRFMWVALAPEGTRRKTAGWRTGFYQTVLKAGVPLGLGHLDFKTKTVTLLQFIAVSGDEAKDFERLAKIFNGTRGLYHDNAAPVTPRSLRPPKDPPAR